MTDKRIIEISGIKLETDLRHAVRIDTVRVGTKVKVLKKSYSNEVYSGVVIGFEPFPSRPSIIVAYVNSSYSGAKIETVAINGESKDFEIIVALDDEPLFNRATVEKLFDKERIEAKRKLEDVDRMEAVFSEQFASYWAAVAPQHEPEAAI